AQSDRKIIRDCLRGSPNHQDDFSRGAVIEAGQWQRMSAGAGIVHSEFNPSETASTHLYQIWLFPDKKGLKPEYEDRVFDEQELHDGWQLVASGDGRDDSMHIHQAADRLTATPQAGTTVAAEFLPDRF